MHSRPNRESLRVLILDERDAGEVLNVEVDMKKWLKIFLIPIIITIIVVILWLLPLQEWGNTIQSIDSVIQIGGSIISAISWLWVILSKQKKGDESLSSTVERKVTKQKIIAENGSISGNILKDNEITINNFKGEQIFENITKPNKVDFKKITEEYNKTIYNLYQYLEFKGMGINERIPLKMPLLDLFVPLHVRRDIPEHEKSERIRLLTAEVGGRELLDDEGLPKKLSDSEHVMNTLQENKSLVILGDPGSGKSTLLKWLTLIMVTGQAEHLGLNNRLPILLSLSSYAKELENGNDCPLDKFIITHFQNRISEKMQFKELFDFVLEEGKAIILLDGLDEIKSVDLRQTIVDRVKRYHAYYTMRGNQFILTSRIVGYKEVRFDGENIQEATLVDFDNEQIEDFVSKWTDVIEKLAQEDKKLAEKAAEKERIELLNAVQHNAGVRSLAANPLLLTILCSMKRQGITLPERRVQLYQKYIEVLISQWNQTRSIDANKPGRNLNVRQIVKILAPLAFWMHKNSAGLGLVKMQDLRRELIRIFSEEGEKSPEEATDQFLADVREFACILIERGEGEYGFIHLTFEEYLAGVGVALAGQGNAEKIAKQIAKTVDESIWRESNLLAIAYVTLIQNLDSVAADVIRWLIEKKPGQPEQAVLLAGEALIDAGQDTIPPVVCDEVINALIPVFQSKDVIPIVRHRSGIVVSKLGWIPDDLDWFLPIPAGTTQLGEEENWRTINLDYDFWMAKYPVTNFQYQRFIEAEGYKNELIWGKEGKKWLKKTNRKLPRLWNSSSFNIDLLPVVGITWYEAEAYCNWVNQQHRKDGVQTPVGRINIPDGYEVRLPLEWEWEYAARGEDGLTYPWGNEFVLYSANTVESEIRTSTIVNTFPDGKSPFGVWDMAGNVWEWQLSKYKDSRDFRVLRGGSWHDDGGSARCALRSRGDPDLYLNNVGFRMLLSRSSSDAES